MFAAYLIAECWTLEMKQAEAELHFPVDLTHPSLYVLKISYCDAF